MALIEKPRNLGTPPILPGGRLANNEVIYQEDFRFGSRPPLPSAALVTSTVPDETPRNETGCNETCNVTSPSCNETLQRRSPSDR